ncbi:MAG: FtsW/RodA/SpoVE family cell cycle protein, partial [Bacilli bacterium]|nr:FtsW/RodA/SpoVE family cell cycle protein [Bacilli bacterium]
MDSKRKLLDKTIFGVVIFLTLFGYIMVVSAHASVWLKYGAIKFFFEIGKIFVFIIFGFFLMTTINNKYNQKWLNRNFNKIFLIIIAMMIATIFFAAESGAKAWIRIPLVNITLQPVEFLKIALIIYLSNYFAGAIKNKLSLKDMLLAPIIVVFSAV